MKYQIRKDLNKVIILLVVISSVVSCSMDENFSCDKDANQWVKSNLTEIRKMSSSDFFEIDDLVYMKAAYNAFTPSQRQTIWIDKLENVLKLEWTEKESQFIESIFEFVKLNSFIFSEDRDEISFNKAEKEFYKWSVYAFEELKWDKKLLYSIVGTPQELKENKEIKSNLKSQTKLKTRGETIDCECSVTSDWCFGYTAECKKVDCIKSLGCGTLFLYTCDGEC